MSRVGVIVISYRADPAPLFDSIGSARHHVTPYIFEHGSDPEIRRRLDDAPIPASARYFAYGVNRGVARSWNEGLHHSFEDGNDITIIVNDDLHFYEDGFDRFVDFINSSRDKTPNFGAITTYGMETGTDHPIGSSRFFRTRNWQGGACLAIGRKAVETVGYFDQNFWPAYYEDADYFRRLELSGLPILWDERTLLEHNRSYTLRADPFLMRLHGERNRRNEAYYLRKWGGLRDWGGPDVPPGAEELDHPFGETRFGYSIPWANREAPYGAPYDRDDLGAAKSLGVLEGDFAEDLLAVLARHAGSAARLLEWGTGAATMTLAGFAQARRAEMLLSIDHRPAVVRQLRAELPKLRFLHLRCIDDGDPSVSDNGPDLAYASDPTMLGIFFDVVLIGDRSPQDCAEAAARALAPGGIVILNQGRWRLQDAALRKLYDVVEETARFLVLRGKSGVRARRRGGR